MNMQFRRSGQRDERRRRVLIEETAVRVQDAAGRKQGSDTGADRADGPGSNRAHRRYPATTLTERQPLLVAAIPAGWCSAVSVTGILLAGIAGLEALYGYVALGHTQFSIESLPAIDLTSRSSIAAWGGSILLLAAGLFGVLTYFIRRHRLDDYRGRYRMWYWVVPVLMLAALDQVSNLQESVRNALLIVAGIPGYADAATVQLGLVSVLVAVVLVRLAIELRDCRFALLSVLMAGLCYATVAAIGLDWVLAGATVFRVMAHVGLILAGHFCLFTAVMLNARYVYRDAAGRVHRKPRARRTAAAKDPAGAPAATGRTARQKPLGTRRVFRRDTAHTTTGSQRGATKTGGNPNEKVGSTTRPRAKQTQAAVRRTVSDLATPPPAEEDTPRKLTKAERRKLRKTRRQKRQSAA